MKKVIIAAMLLIGVIATAQTNTSKENSPRKGLSDLTPEQMAILKTKKMTLALDLTASQQEKIKTLQLENAKLRQSKMEERKAQKEAGDTKKRSSEERFNMANARLDRQIAQKTEMKKILSETQYEKWEKMNHRRGKKSKGKYSGSHHGHKGKRN